MKIVTHTEMLALPPGTVFSFFGERDGGPQGELLGIRWTSRRRRSRSSRASDPTASPKATPHRSR
jgi:hypothetical protein